MLIYQSCGRERGIRTPGGVILNGFQDRRYRPLSHLPRKTENLDWRRHPDSNWGIKALQAHALPLGYVAIYIVVPEAGLEPARTQCPRDFKSLVSTISPPGH